MFKPPETSQYEGSYQRDYERIAKYSLIPLTIVPFYASLTGGVMHPYWMHPYHLFSCIPSDTVLRPALLISYTEGKVSKMA